MIRAGRQLIIPLYAADVLGLSPAQVGLVMAVAAVLDASMFVPAGVLMDRFGRKTAAVPSFAIMSLGVALIPLASNMTGLILVASLVGFGNGIGAGTMMTLGADLAPAGATGEFLGVWRLIGDTGAFIGPLAAGLLANGAGLRDSALLLASFGVVSALILALMVRETRHVAVSV
jgi:MFS family permease